MISSEHFYFIQNLFTKARCSLIQESILAFARTYLPDQFALPPSSMHREIAELLKDATQNRQKRIAIAAPRHYKQCELLSIAYVLWSICHQKESFILLVGDTLLQASEQLLIVKDNLESNQALTRDFPNATGKNTKSWQATYFTSRNGIKVVATGLNQKLKMRTYNSKRPSLIIFDILQEHPFSSERIFEDENDYFKNTLEHMCSLEANVIVVGTIMHYKSILAKLFVRLDSDWICKKYQAVLSEAQNQSLWDQWQSIFRYEKDYQGDSGPQMAEVFFNDNRQAMLEGTEVLWPEHEDYAKIMDQKMIMNCELFNSEKQNLPHDPFAARRQIMRAELAALERAQENKLTEEKDQPYVD